MIVKLSLERPWALVYIDPAPPWWKRWRYTRFSGVWVRLHRSVRQVTVFSGDMSVRVEGPPGKSVHSARTGSASGTHVPTGRYFHVETAPAYLAAAERQGIPVVTVEGTGYTYAD